MERFLHPVKNKYTAGLLALLLLSFFLAGPAVAAGPEDFRIEFRADRTQVRAGECLNIYWDTANVREVYYNGQGVSGIRQTRLECPAGDQAYTLRVVTQDGQEIQRQVQVNVVDPGTGQDWDNWENWNDNAAISFWADRTQVRPGECLNVYWTTDNVSAVYYNGRGVPGIEQHRLECPGQDTVYELRVVTRNNREAIRQIQVDVVYSGTGGTWENWNNAARINFWADRTQVRPGECLNVRWDTANVSEVYYNGRGVSGIDQGREECPGRDTRYELRVITRDNQEILRQIEVDVAGGLAGRGELTMASGQAVDIDRDGRISDNEDDFRWFWTDTERGVMVKVSDDEDLRLAYAIHGSPDSFNRLSQDNCREALDRRDSGQVELTEESMVCFRTDEGEYGKFRVNDIRSTNGQLFLDWVVWE